MQSRATTVEQYINELPEVRKEAISTLRKEIVENLPDGFEECMSYGMIGYVVPHSLFPAGYHCDPTMPLPFISLASQKNHVAVYHMAILGKSLFEWFTDAYAKQVKTKLDMGKCCIRFKNVNNIPYTLIGELASKMTPAEWIACYELARSAQQKA